MNRNSTVVVYDYKYDATRLWWAFLVYGTDIRVLDGGFVAWETYCKSKSAHLHAVCNICCGDQLLCSPGCTDQRKRPRGNWQAEEKKESFFADQATVRSASVSLNPPLWDVRTEDEHTGKLCMMYAKWGGKIANSTRIDWFAFTHSNTTKKWLTAKEAKRSAKQLGLQNTENLFYCHSGVRTTQIIFACHVLLGWELPLLRNFDGSWIEWSADNPQPTESLSE